MQDHIAEELRHAYPKLVAALTRALQDMELARDAAHEAMARAVQRWPAEGLPENPVGWLVIVGRNVGIDQQRRAQRETPLPEDWAERESTEPFPHISEALLNDDLLRLLFTCCHPALGSSQQIALMLRIVLDFSTAEIAAALLERKDTIERRITRAKAKLRDSGAAFVTPTGEALAQREDAVLSAVYLLFNQGYSQALDPSAQHQQLMSQAIRLTRLLVRLFTNSGLTRSLLALLLLTAARTPARMAMSDRFVPLEDHNRELWDWTMIAEGRAVLDAVMAARHPPNVYQVQAAIAALHSVPASAQTDWDQIAGLYEQLFKLTNNPIVRVNQAVALCYSGAPQQAHALISAIEETTQLADYQPLYSARAHILRQLNQPEAARRAYQRAIELSDVPSEQRWLEQQVAALQAPR